MSKKRVITNQKYEDYWKLTLEYTDYTKEPFNRVLEKIVDYIDKYSDPLEGMSSKRYRELQKEIGKCFPKANSASTRKSINQMFKLGFINNRAKSYHYLTKEFIKETDFNKKRAYYSRIVYDNASFNRSFSVETNENELQFLVKTIEHLEKINKEELLAIMFCKISDYPAGYLKKRQLEAKVNELRTNGTIERKYNQQSYLYNLCGTLTDIYTANNEISLNPNLVMDEQEKGRKGRDSYLQRVYKTELIEEEKALYGDSIQKCVLEHRGYPILIASHIKPYRVCETSEQFDRDNGLLLSKNMDSLFDSGYITFDNDGNVVTSSNLDQEVADYVKGFKLDGKILNLRRQMYMQYHRDHVFLG